MLQAMPGVDNLLENTTLHDQETRIWTLLPLPNLSD